MILTIKYPPETTGMYSGGFTSYNTSIIFRGKPVDLSPYTDREGYVYGDYSSKYTDRSTGAKKHYILLNVQDCIGCETIVKVEVYPDSLEAIASVKLR